MPTSENRLSVKLLYLTVRTLLYIYDRTAGRLIYAMKLFDTFVIFAGACVDAYLVACIDE